MTSKAYFLISAAVFAVVALLHLVRAASRWAFQVGPLALPIWLSWVGGVAAAALCIWAIRLANRP